MIVGKKYKHMEAPAFVWECVIEGRTQYVMRKIGDDQYSTINKAVEYMWAEYTPLAFADLEAGEHFKWKEERNGGDRECMKLFAPDCRLNGGGSWIYIDKADGRIFEAGDGRIGSSLEVVRIEE